MRLTKLVVGVVSLMAALVASQAMAETHKLKVATFITQKHGMSKWIDNWAKGLEEKSGGQLKFEILHGAQMGPPPKYYDLARNGQADIVWHLHGATPGRFELVEISHLPFLFCSAEQATMVLNNSVLREKYLDAEHKGTKVLALFMHPPGQINMNGDAIKTVADLKGKAIRPASRAVGAFIGALGGKPVGLPPTAMAEALQKGTIDGTFTDYGGAGLAFQLGPHLKNITEMYAYTVSFTLAMNPATFDGLPADLQAMIEESFAGKSAEIGQVWDELGVIGKGVLKKAGVKINMLNDGELDKFRAIGEKVSAEYIATVDKKGKPASEVLAMMKDLIKEVGPVGPGCQQ